MRMHFGPFKAHHTPSNTNTVAQVASFSSNALILGENMSNHFNRLFLSIHVVRKFSSSGNWCLKYFISGSTWTTARLVPGINHPIFHNRFKCCLDPFLGDGHASSLGICFASNVWMRKGVTAAGAFTWVRALTLWHWESSPLSEVHVVKGTLKCSSKVNVDRTCHLH